MFKKIIKIFLLFVFYLLFNKSILAFEFIKLSSNPLNVSYINNYAYHLQVNVFKEGNIYKGIFVINRPPETYYSLGYFESVNGIDWQMKKEILNTGDDLSNPSIIKTETGYLLFVSRHDDRTVYRIYSSVCDTDFNCSSDLVPVITPDTNNSSEKNGVFAGRPFVQDNRTYLFFGAWGGDGFKIKLAYSDDLAAWQRCPNSGFLYGGDGPFPYKENNDLYLFFHRSDSSGIKFAKTTLPLTCDSVFEDQGYLLTRDASYDQKHLIFPSVLNNNGGLKLYYSGLGNDNRWHFNLACTGDACLFGSEDPTPTATPTPIHTKIPIVIIPGFMASWNKNAILHNQSVNQPEWKLGSYVKEYQGLINTLKNLGFEENKDFFIFAYDWRKPILEIVEDLKSFINQFSISDSQFSIIGHSLGGLTARIYQQKYQNDNLKKLITVGSPHNGVVQVYKPLETGELDRENTFLWLAEKLVLFLNKTEIESDKETIRKRFPVAFDVFPVFNFLKDESGQEIPVENLSIKNDLLNTYNQSFDEVYDIFTAIYGEKDNNTLAGFVVDADGKPKDSYFEGGDYLVLKKSAKQDNDAERFVFDHGEIIYKKEAIKKILSLLDIEFNEDQVVEGEKTNISHSLIFLIRSPAVMTVEFASSIYIEDEGMIFIPDAQSGSYHLKVQGTDLGKYEVIVGQISENNDIWESIKGEITQSPASSEIDSYYIQYNNQTALSIFPSPTPTITPATISPMTQTTGLMNQTPTKEPESNNQSSSVVSLPQSTQNILGISSSQEELITPVIEPIKKTETKKEVKKSSLWDHIWPSIASILLGGTGWFFRKKLFRK